MSTYHTGYLSMWRLNSEQHTGISSFLRPRFTLGVFGLISFTLPPTFTTSHSMIHEEIDGVRLQVFIPGRELTSLHDYLQDSELPGYVPRESTSRLVEHTRTAQNSAGVTVTIQSYAKTPEATPVFFSGRPISGNVTLTLRKKTTSIKKVTITIKGYIRGTHRGGQGDDKTFLQITSVLWPNERDLPHGTRKLEPDTHSWGFSEILPRTTSLISEDGAEVALPPSFSHRGTSRYVLYEIALLVETGAFSFNYGWVQFVIRPASSPLSFFVQTHNADNIHSAKLC
jgi:hypothetical protein